MPDGIERDIDLTQETALTTLTIDATNPVYYNDTDVITIEGSGAYTVEVLTNQQWVPTAVSGTATGTPTVVDLSSVVFSESPKVFRVVGGVDVVVRKTTEIKVIQSLPLGTLNFWSPLDEGSLVLWMDGQDIDTFTFSSGNEIDTWTSKVDSYSFSYQGSIRPTFNADYVEAFGDSRLDISDNLGVFGDPELAVLAVVEPNTSGQSIFFDIGEPSDGRPRISLSSNEYAWRYLNGNSVFPSNGSVEVLVVIYRLPGAREFNSCRADGVDLTVSEFAEGVTNAEAGVSRIFGSYSGRVKQLLVFSSTDQDVIEKAEGWAAHQTGRQSFLPNDHPYKNTPPLADPPDVSVQPPVDPPASFDLLNEPGIEFWVNTDEPSEITTDMTDGVTNWDARVSSREFTQTVPTDAPTLVSGIPDFDNSDFLEIADRGGFAESAMQAMVIAVARVDAFGNRTIATIGASRFGNQAGSVELRASRKDVVISLSDGDRSSTYSGLPTSTDYELLSYVVDGTTLSFYLNGELQTPTATDDVGTEPVGNTLERMTISRSSATFNGDIKTMAGFSQVTTDTRQKAEGVFAHQHGLAAKLPAGHPYKDNPPS